MDRLETIRSGKQTDGQTDKRQYDANIVDQYDRIKSVILCEQYNNISMQNVQQLQCIR